MSDREKVIMAIEICIKSGCKDGIPNKLCPYSSEVGCDLNQILADALAMLKEQQQRIEALEIDIDILVKDINTKNCNTCKRECEHRPRFGETVRANCFMWEGT